MDSVKAYLGSSVYVEYVDGRFILTRDGDTVFDSRNVIVLEMAVAETFLRFYINRKAEDDRERWHQSNARE